MRSYLAKIYALLHLPTKGRAILDDIKQGRSTAQTAVFFVITILIFSGIFGIAVGAFNGGLQILYVLIKLPLLFLATLAVTICGAFIIDLVLGTVLSFKQYLLLVLTVLAVTSLALAPLSIILYFFIATFHSHDFIVLVASVLFGIAGFFGVYAFFVARKHFLPQEQGKRRLAALLILLILYSFVGLQMAWMLKPWVGLFLEPHASPPFLRETIKGNVYVEIYRAFNRLQKGKYY